MNTLTDIENATETLSPAEKQELLLFLATPLRGERRGLPAPRKFEPQQVAAWIAEDEADLQRFSQNS